MDSFYIIFLYPITFILSPFLTNHLGFGVDMFSKLGFLLSLFNNYLAMSAKCLGGTVINVYRNHDGFCIGSALNLSDDHKTFDGLREQIC